MDGSKNSDSKQQGRKAESNEEDSDIDDYDKSDAEPIHVDVDKGNTGSSQSILTLALLPSRSKEEKINNNGQRGDGNGKFGVRSSNRLFKTPERVGSVLYFWI